ncbi:hypothetical protein OFO07_07340 [Campylobacter sp. JMF_06 NA1]|nr:hypothetical protein [Campylobacter sp. JMF_06 NA1]MDA3078728.1 hypothetical protein [Campylobacter sp. JMF_06 NA1]
MKFCHLNFASQILGYCAENFIIFYSLFMIVVGKDAYPTILVLRNTKLFG